MTADYSMTDEKWNNWVSTIEADLETRDGLDEQVVNAIQTFIIMGTTNAESRKKWRQNISNMYSGLGLENSPIRPGLRNVYPADVVKNVNVASDVYAESHAALFATDPLFGELERKRGKAKGQAYASPEEYGQAKAGNLSTRLLGYYKNHVNKALTEIRWDGTVDKNGRFNLLLPETEETPEVDG